MNLTVGKIVGNLSETSWSQVHSFRPEDGKLTSHGELLAAISFKAKAEIDISSFGSEIIQRLQEIYYSNEAGSVFKKLGQAIETLVAEFLDQVELEVVALVVWKDYLYAAKNSSGQVWLKRGEALVPLFTGPANIMITVSGRLEPGDSLAAATGELMKLVPEGSLRVALGQAAAAAAAETLAAPVYGHKDSSRAAAVVVKIEPEVKAAVMASPVPVRKPIKLSLGRWLGRIIPKKPITIFVGGRDNKNRRLSLMVGLVLLAVFGASLILAGSKKQNEARQQAYRAVVDEVNYKLDEANNLLLLNPLRAKSLLAESNTIIKEYKEKEKKPNKEISDLEVRVAAALEQAQREYSVTAAEWYDFDLIKEGFRGERWDLNETEAAVWDKNQRAAVKLNLDTKAAEIIAAGDNLGPANAIGLTDGRAFVAAPDKVTVIDTVKAAVVAQVEADNWQKIIVARGFGGNLYLLDSAITGQIWKYLGLDDGLSGKRSYLVGDSFDLSSAVDMAIDGSVWVLFSDGTIVKYTQGKKDAFAIIGLDQPPGEPVKLFTGPDEDHLYIIDRANTRVVVLNKSGEYAAQYQWSGIAGVKDFAVAEALGKMFFLTGEKVFTIDLK